MPLDRRRYNYHEAPWREWRTKDNSRQKLRGIELELHAKRSWIDVADALPEPLAREAHPQLEEDGSLSYDKGIEIIFPPIRADKLLLDNSYFVRAVKAVKEHVQERANGYGMHVNVNCAHWRQQSRDVFAAVINTMPENKLKRFGGRDDGPGHLPYDYDDYWRDNKLSAPEYEHDHRCELQGGETRLECRFPKATTDLAAITKLMSFIDVLEKFSRSRSANRVKEADESYPEFIKWLYKQEDKEANAVKQILTA